MELSREKAENEIMRIAVAQDQKRKPLAFGIGG